MNICSDTGPAAQKLIDNRNSFTLQHKIVAKLDDIHGKRL